MEQGTYKLHRINKYQSPKKISRLGFISCALSTIELISICPLVGVHHDPFYLVWAMDPYLPGNSAVSFYFSTGIYLIPAVLGIAGFFEKNRTKVINIFGVLLSLFVVLGLWAIQLFIAYLGDEY